MVFTHLNPPLFGAESRHDESHEDVGCQAEQCAKGQPDANPSTKGTAAAKQLEGPRLIILGFDGVDPRRVDALIAEGRLPNIKAMGEKGWVIGGGYGKMKPSFRYNWPPMAGPFSTR